MRKFLILLVLTIATLQVWPPGQVSANTNQMEDQIVYTVSDDTPEATLQVLATVTPAELNAPLLIELFTYHTDPGTMQDKPGMLVAYDYQCSLPMFLSHKYHKRAQVGNLSYLSRDCV